MSRNAAERKHALDLDGRRCQITGAAEKDGKLLEVHHVRPLGIGGSDELDNAENMITLSSDIHVKVETGQIVIAEWERPNECTDGILEVIDNQNALGHGKGRVDKKLLWFYRRKEAEEGEQILSELARFTMLDKTIAERVHRLGQVVNSTDPDARSLRECLASRGLLASQLLSAAKLYAKSLEERIDWPDGMSMSDYRRLLADAGHSEKREWFYVVIPPKSWLTGARPEVYYRTAYEAELRDTMEMGARLYKLGKVCWGLRAENGKLIRPDGTEEDVIHFTPEEAE